MLWDLGMNETLLNDFEALRKIFIVENQLSLKKINFNLAKSIKYKGPDNFSRDGFKFFASAETWHIFKF